MFIKPEITMPLSWHSVGRACIRIIALLAFYAMVALAMAGFVLASNPSLGEPGTFPDVYRGVICIGLAAAIGYLLLYLKHRRFI